MYPDSVTYSSHMAYFIFVVVIITVTTTTTLTNVKWYAGPGLYVYWMCLLLMRGGSYNLGLFRSWFLRYCFLFAFLFPVQHNTNVGEI